MQSESAPLIIAIDGGGTSCRAKLLRPDGQVLAEAHAGPANVASDFETSCTNIVAASAILFANAEIGAERLHESAAYLALAGASDPKAEPRLRAALDFARLDLISDIEATVLGALAGEDGVVAGIGTGSFFCARREGRLRRVGGRGFQLSDECSGAWLGRELLRETARAHDGLRPHSPLSRAIMARFGDDINELVAFSLRASPQDYGRFAPELVAAREAGDEIAGAIFARALDELARSLDVLEGDAPGRLCLVGGLGATYEALLPERFRARIAPARGSALDGIVAFALEQEAQRATGRAAP